MKAPSSRRLTATLLGGWVVLVLGFLFVPIAIILTYAFDTSPIQGWPIAGFTTHWFIDTWADEEVREAFVLSTEVALAATLPVSAGCRHARSGLGPRPSIHVAAGAWGRCGKGAASTGAEGVNAMAANTAPTLAAPAGRQVRTPTGGRPVRQTG